MHYSGERVDISGMVLRLYGSWPSKSNASYFLGSHNGEAFVLYACSLSVGFKIVRLAILLE